MERLRKKKRVQPKQEAPMSKEEYFETNIRNHSIFYGETPKEEDLNREWDIYRRDLQYHAIRGRTKKQTEKMKAAFAIATEQQLIARYAPERLEAWREKNKTYLEQLSPYISDSLIKI